MSLNAGMESMDNKGRNNEEVRSEGIDEKSEAGSKLEKLPFRTYEQYMDDFSSQHGSDATAFPRSIDETSQDLSQTKRIPEVQSVDYGQMISSQQKTSATGSKLEDVSKKLLDHGSQTIKHPVYDVIGVREYPKKSRSRMLNPASAAPWGSKFPVHDDDFQSSISRTKKTESLGCSSKKRFTEPSIILGNWLSSSKTLSEMDYLDLYEFLAKTEEKPMLYCSTIMAEGEFLLKAILFVPDKRLNDSRSNLRLSVGTLPRPGRDPDLPDVVPNLPNPPNFLPLYLNFLLGMLDLENLPPMSSEQSSVLKTVTDHIVEKALDMVFQIADSEKDSDASIGVQKSGYAKFWQTFGECIKLGVIEDAGNRDRLVRLLRFESSKSHGNLVSLDEYMSRMRGFGQLDIFYTTDTEQLEGLTDKNYEVLFFVGNYDKDLVKYLIRSGYNITDVTEQLR